MEEKPESNPFLCDDCQKIGFCKIAYRREVSERSEEKRALKMGSNNLNNLVPLNAEHHGYGNFTRPHLQTAFDAFHQQDYETAILHSMAVLEVNPLANEANICIALSNYFLGNYGQAFDYAQRVSPSYYYSEEYKNERWEKFILLCQNALDENKNEELKLTISYMEVVPCYC